MVVFGTFEQHLLSSRQMANCSTLEELQYEKHFHRDGDDCTDNEQVVVVDRTQGDLAVGNCDRLQHVSDVRRCKTKKYTKTITIPQIKLGLRKNHKNTQN